MKNLIKQILREETSGLSDAEKNAAYKLMNMLTKRYHWYHDTPEQPFKYTKGSIWLINPDTEEWMLELRRTGYLWYRVNITAEFYKFMNMKEPEFEKFIQIWTSDTLNKDVFYVHKPYPKRKTYVKDVIDNGQQLK